MWNLQARLGFQRRERRPIDFQLDFQGNARSVGARAERASELNSPNTTQANNLPQPGDSYVTQITFSKIYCTASLVLEMGWIRSRGSCT